KKSLKEVFIDCKTDGWGYDFEFLLKCEKNGFKIKEIPVKWIAGEESKVTIKSYVNTFVELMKIWWQEIGISRGFIINIFVRTRTFQKYFVGGVITNLINIGVFFYLLYGLKVADFNIKGFTIPNYILIESVAYLVCVIFNFIYHKFFTFRSNQWNLKELIRYIVLLLINYFIGIVLLFIMIDLLGIYQSYAKLISMVVVILWNFFALKLFVYRS
ncbi:GtrA family protein, partial [Candidatus Dojkabacteria bacterium]|nr:GtrA family protein [Candidatus Dojkabacteria bacterium]